MGRAPCCSKVGLNRGAWTAEEDQILCDYIKLHGEGNWRNLPKNAGLKRCGKSCRLRWMNYLRPDIKRGNISRDEEELIVRLHKLLGNRWSLIAGRLPGRTDNEIKNYWNTHLSKKVQLPSESRIKICRVRRPKSSPQQKEQASSAKAPVKTIAVKPQVEPKTVSNDSSAPHKPAAAAAAAEQLDVSMSWQELLICSLPCLESEHAEHLNQDPAAKVMDVEKLLDFNDYCDLSSPSASSPDFDVLSHGLKDDLIIGDAGMDDWIHQLEQPGQVLSFMDSQWAEEEDASAQPYLAVDVHDC